MHGDLCGAWVSLHEGTSDGLAAFVLSLREVAVRNGLRNVLAALSAAAVFPLVLHRLIGTDSWKT